MTLSSDPITSRLSEVRDRVIDATRESGRACDAVRLIVVSKSQPAAAVEAAIAAGATDLGESRVQELEDKLSVLEGRVNVHFIGHLQRNKSARATAHADLIHTVDSEPLLAAIDRHAGRLRKTQAVLLEVNTSGDTSKFGIAPEALSPLVEAALSCENVRVRGLMTIGPRLGGETGARQSFAHLRRLADNLRRAGIAEPIELSMGMSNDFEAAIEEGSTMVRVGSAIFGERGVT